MSIKVIERMKHDCNEIVHGLRHKDFKKVASWLKEMEGENNEQLSLAKEFKIKFLLSLHGFIGKEIIGVKKNVRNRRECIKYVKKIKRALNGIVDQREVRDKLIKEVIQPLFKKWGYKKKGRAFTKDNKKVNLYTSQFCDYYDTQFIFEITIMGTKFENHRVAERWFELNQDTDLEKVKKEIEVFLRNSIKPFLDKFR
jgi:hypothetical protein